MRPGEKGWQNIYSGERSFIGKARNAVIQAALARYHFALPFCEGRKVLDIGCGSGFGVRLLADVARRAVGLDYSAETLLALHGSLLLKGVWAVAGSALAMPFTSGSFDVITAFEIIEHLSNPELLLVQGERVLTSSGTLVLSTPNRPVYSPRGTWLDYHVKEYDYQELRKLLGRIFPHMAFYGQAHLSKDSQLDMNPLNRFFYPLKRRIDPRGVVFNRLRAAYVYLRWGEKATDCTIDDFPVVSESVETQPVLIAVCRKIAGGK